MVCDAEQIVCRLHRAQPITRSESVRRCFLHTRRQRNRRQSYFEKSWRHAGVLHRNADCRRTVAAIADAGFLGRQLHFASAARDEGFSRAFSEWRTAGIEIARLEREIW